MKSYAELIQNRAFQGDFFTPSTLTPWQSFGDAALTLQETSPPLSAALPWSVNVKAAGGAEVGITNPGYWGIEVKPQTYTGSFYVLGEYSGVFTAALRRSRSGPILATANITSRSVAGSWTKHTYTMVPTQSSRGSEAVFTLTWTPTNSSQSLNFNLISLFPPTYKDHGLRIDLMEALAALKPSFFLFSRGQQHRRRAGGLVMEVV